MIWPPTSDVDACHFCPPDPHAVCLWGPGWGSRELEQERRAGRPRAPESGLRWGVSGSSLTTGLASSIRLWFETWSSDSLWRPRRKEKTWQTKGKRKEVGQRKKAVMYGNLK